MKTSTKEEVFDRLMQAAKAKTIAELSRILGYNQQTVYSWRKRSAIPIAEISNKLHNINTHWLLTGEGEMLVSGGGGTVGGSGTVAGQTQFRSKIEAEQPMPQNIDLVTAILKQLSKENNVKYSIEVKPGDFSLKIEDLPQQEENGTNVRSY
jgi:hypothetical protein